MFAMNPEYVDNRLLINSIFIGLMLSCNVLSMILKFIPNGIVFLIFFPFVFLCCKNFKSVVNRKLLIEFFICFTFFFAFFLYSLIVGYGDEMVVKYIEEFVVLGMPFIIASHFYFLPKIVLKSIAIFSAISLPILISEINLEFVSYATDGEELMVASYNLIKIAIPAVLILLLDRISYTSILFLFIVYVSIIVLINIGSRGAIVALFLSIVLAILYRKRTKLYLFSKISIVILSLFIICFLNFYDILVFISNLFDYYNIHSIPLERLIFTMNSHVSDLSQGRDILYEKAIFGFFDSPILGNGIGSFDNYSGAYPHNLFLQQLYEGGMLFGFPIAVVSVLSFKLLNSRISKDYRYFVICLISTSIIHLLFSSYFWSSSIYWFLFGLSIRNFVTKDINDMYIPIQNAHN